MRRAAVVLTVVTAGVAPVASAHADPQSTDHMDPATRATMRRQEALQPALTAIWDEQMKTPDSGFAGVAFEGAGLSVYWKGGLTRGMAAAVARAARTGPVVVKPAAYSSAELHAASASIETRMRLGATDIQSIQYPTDGSALHVVRHPPAAVASLTATRARLGETPVVTAATVVGQAHVSVPVVYETAQVDSHPQVTREADNPPWNGGDRMWNSTVNTFCTTGFGVHVGAHSYVLSAAHCADAGDVLKQGDPTQNHAVVMGPVKNDDQPYDLLLIDAPGWHVIFDGDSATWITKPVHSWGYWAANELVCQSGSTSGTECGIQEHYSGDDFYTRDADGNTNYPVFGLIWCTKTNGGVPSREGDSGSPVFTLDGDGVRAKGIVAAGDGVTWMEFQDWADVIREFNAYPNVNNGTS